MEFYLTLAAIILLCLGGLSNLVRQYQMLQQNSYFASRYFGWLKTNVPLSQFLAYFIASVLLNFNLYYALSVFSAAFFVISLVAAVKNQKKSIKRLVFTGRIKRLFGCAFLIFAAAVCLYAIFTEIMLGKISFVIVLTLCTVSPLTVFICLFATLPIEKAFAAYYINDAKKLLKAHGRVKVIGITGSYGKTTTKFILTRILSEKYNTLCTPHSFNTTMGVVRTIRESLKPQTQVFVCEMGAKNKGDIKEICDVVSPDFALITSVGAQHLETFKTVDNVFATKFELSDAVLKKGGKVFANGDSTELIKRVDKSACTLYGTGDNEIKVENIVSNRNGSQFDLVIKGEKISLSTRLLGMHSIINIAGAAAVAYELGVDANSITFAVASLKPTEHRLEMKNWINNSVMIDDAYNSNPEGCLEAVRVLGSFEGMQKVIITPGLIELGEKEYDANFALGLEAAKICDIIIFVGKNRSKPLMDGALSGKFDKEKIFVAESFKEAVAIYSKFANNQTAVLLENDLPDNYLN